MLDSITTYLADLPPMWLYFALFLSAYVENVFPPVPGDTVTVFAGYLLGRSDRSVWGVIAATTLGSVGGFMTYYALGRLIHPEYFLRRNFRLFPASRFRLAQQWFERWGLWLVLFNRFFSGVRSVLSIVAGMCRLPWLRVLVLTGIGCAFWNGLLIWGGYLLGVNWTAIQRIFAHYNRILLGLACLSALFFILRKRLRAPRNDA